MKRPRSVTIAGAGLAGLAVAVALRRRGFTGPIRIVDRKSAFANDRTWCWWRVAGVPFADRATHAWDRWRITDGGGGAAMRSAAHPYVHLRARDYYAACLAELDASDTEIVLGEAVCDIIDDCGKAALRTIHREYRCDLIIDARGGRAATRLNQLFGGINVVAGTPVFDARTVTLMDFTAASDGMQFMYVLPFSPYEALVEHTVVDAGAVNPHARRLSAERYLRERFGISEWSELRSESGAIPLGAERVPARPSPRVIRAGIAAGTTRASSGYTYIRTHRHAAAIAAHVVDGLPLAAAGSRLAVLDGLLLAAIERGIVDVPRILGRLAQRVSGDAFARFMSDAANPGDEARICAAIAAAFPEAFRPRIAALARA